LEPRVPGRFKEGSLVTERVKKILFWTPRVLSILIAIFISLFALDVFIEGYSFWETIMALLMHLIPTVIFLVILGIAWRWDRIGGILFILLGLLYIILFWDPDQLPAYLLISGPLLLQAYFSCWMDIFAKRAGPDRAVRLNSMIEPQGELAPDSRIENSMTMLRF